MKKIILTSFFAVACLISFAQWGIIGGINLSKYAYSDSNFDTDRKIILAFNAGLLYKKSLSEKIYLLPQLVYSIKGANVYHSYPIGYTGPMKHTNKLNYTQVSFPIIASLPITDEFDFEIGAGPFMAYLINGTQKEEEFDGTSTTAKFNSDAFNHADYGLIFTTGFQMGKKLGFHINYDWGFANIEPGKSNPTIKTRNFSINMSWIFAHND